MRGDMQALQQTNADLRENQAMRAKFDTCPHGSGALNAEFPLAQILLIPMRL
jgi:hypothetical protein